MIFVFNKLVIFFLIFFSFISDVFANKYYGKGPLKLADFDVEYLMEYSQPPAGRFPLFFFIAAENGTSEYATYWYCPKGSCIEGSLKEAKKACERSVKKYYKKYKNSNKELECFIFARKYKIVWNNEKYLEKDLYKISSKWNKSQLVERLKELGFYGTASLKINEEDKNEEDKKVETQKNDNKKITKKYEESGERSIALSWEGYDDLIAGKIKFDEANYKGTLKLPLPNNDGNCEGTYSLQEGGKGTWQIACTNNMGAAGTLKWNKNGGVTGSGRDYNDNKVKFTVSKKS